MPVTRPRKNDSGVLDEAGGLCVHFLMACAHTVTVVQRQPIGLNISTFQAQTASLCLSHKHLSIQILLNL